MNIVLWIGQGILAAVFLLAGSMKTFGPVEMFTAQMPELSPWMVRGIGIVELLGGIGLILPLALKIRPRLTSIAAIGYMIVMVGAIFIHVSHGESPVVNIVLLALAAFVAYGRWNTGNTSTSLDGRDALQIQKGREARQS